MEHEEPPFEFWIPVKDRASATYAAKMSGFPVFLMGLSFAFLGGMQFLLTDNSVEKLNHYILILGGIFFIFSGGMQKAL